MTVEFGAQCQRPAAGDTLRSSDHSSSSSGEPSSPAKHGSRNLKGPLPKLTQILQAGAHFPHLELMEKDLPGLTL